MVMISMMDGVIITMIIISPFYCNLPRDSRSVCVFSSILDIPRWLTVRNDVHKPYWMEVRRERRMKDSLSHGFDELFLCDGAVDVDLIVGDDQIIIFSRERFVGILRLL